MPIDASGNMYVRPEVWAQLAKPLLWKQFVESADNKTLNLAIELSNVLYGSIEGVSFEQAGIAVVGAMIGYYEEFNGVTGASISSKEEFDACVREMRGLSGRGRPLSKSGAFLTYPDKDEFEASYHPAYIEAKKAWPRPTRAVVGERMKPTPLTEKTLSRHLIHHRLPWPPF